MFRRSNLKAWSWAIVFVTSATAVAVSELSGISGKWEDVIVFTVLLFAALILLYHGSWGKWGFWRDLLLTFGLHACVVGAILQTVVIGPHGIPGLVMTGVTMVEGALIIIVWDRLADRSTRPLDNSNDYRSGT